MTNPTAIPDPITDDVQPIRQWGVRITWSDGHVEDHGRSNRLYAETAVRASRQPGRTTELVCQVPGGPWQTVPMPSEPPIARRQRGGVRAMWRLAGEVAWFLVAAGLGALIMYVLLKGQGS